jgi:hypothetical protein
MKTNLKINKNSDKRKLKDIEVGDWFTYQPHAGGYEAIAIKGDETVQEIEKIVCMEIFPTCGFLLKLNKDFLVSVIKDVEIIL